MPTLARPGLLICHREHIQVLWPRRRIVNPLSQQRAAIDDVDGEFAVLELGGQVGASASTSNGKLFIGTMTNEVVAVDLKTLRPIWRFDSRKRQPSSHRGARAFISFVIARASISGAPNNSSGRVVPRPSERVVPSSITVPA